MAVASSGNIDIHVNYNNALHKQISLKKRTYLRIFLSAEISLGKPISQPVLLDGEIHSACIQLFCYLIIFGNC